MCVSFKCGENDSSVRMYGGCFGRRVMGESVSLNGVMSVCGCVIELMCGWYFGLSGIGDSVRVIGEWRVKCV